MSGSSNGNGGGGQNGVLMRTTSREFAVSRALGKYREKQKKQQRSRNTIGSNSDSQEDLDVLHLPLPQNPAAVTLISEEAVGNLKVQGQSLNNGGEEPFDCDEEAEIELFNIRLAKFGRSIDQNVLEAEGGLTATTTEDEFGPPVE